MSYRAIAVEGNRQPVDFKDGQNFGEGQDGYWVKYRTELRERDALDRTTKPICAIKNYSGTSSA